MTVGTITGTSRNTNHVFLDDIDVGEYGEYLAKQYLSNLPGVNIIEDKSNEPSYQKADVDILVETDTRDNKVVGFEIKNDTSLYPNLFFETKSVVKNGKVHAVGCKLVSEAHYLMYIYQSYDVAVYVPLSKLEKWVEKQLIAGHRFRKGYPKNKGYSGEGYLIPIEMLAPENGGIKHLNFVDIRTGKRLNYKKFEQRRKEAIAKLGGTMYAQLTVENNWRTENDKLFPNNNVLNIPLRTEADRTRISRLKLEYLESFYNQTVHWR